MILLKALGKVVREHRLRDQKTLRDFSADLNLKSKRSISDIEHGRRDVKFSTIAKLAQGCGVTLAEFNHLVELELNKSLEELEIKILRKHPLPKAAPSDLPFINHFKLTLGKAVKDVRQKKQINLKTLLFQMGLKGNSFASGVETGKKCPRLRSYFMICNALSIRPSELMKTVEQNLNKKYLNGTRTWSSMKFKT